MKIFFAVLAFILLFGMIGDRDPDNRWNYTIGFIITIAGIIILCGIDGLAVIV